ncbi:hypothetical protein [Ascidiimonas sp. W6]|uniref:hypothetical protein n=1 Tax=Ascidiimonas meishanensis TaxID=3128903 RepID=UPI0030ECBD52
MKKSKIKFLKIRKSIISNLNVEQVKGGWVTSGCTYLAPCGPSGECTTGNGCLKQCER